MAIEPRRGCGYRKVNGLYLMGRGQGMPCDRLPIPLTVCPCCNQGVKQTRGWTWVDVNMLVQGVHPNCKDEWACPLCMAPQELKRAGLLWIGERFYPTVESFMAEAKTQGINRRITVVPREFKTGETWVLLAHPKAVACNACGATGIEPSTFPSVPCPACKGTGRRPGIFHVFRPHAVEKLVTDATPAEELDALRKKGITPVVVPANDRDHQGTVYEDADAEELLAVQ
jgi:hypothetical protein